MKINRSPIAALLAATIGTLALAPSSVAGQHGKVVRCSFKNVPGVRTPAVKTTTRARNTQRGTRWVARCKTARRLVYRAVAKSPTHKRFVDSGFNCRPRWLSEGGLDIRWKCIYKGADNPTYALTAFNLHLHS